MGVKSVISLKMTDYSPRMKTLSKIQYISKIKINSLNNSENTNQKCSIDLVYVCCLNFSMVASFHSGNKNGKFVGISSGYLVSMAFSTASYQIL